MFSSFEEHDEVVKDNILETVKPGDNLYFLGDAFWKWNSKQVQHFMTDLKRHKIRLHWILGNHDKESWTKFSCVVWAGQMKDLVIKKQLITLCHYPLLIYNRSHYSPSVQLHGHVHYRDSTYTILQKSDMYKSLGKVLNMNVEFWDYRPVEFAEIMEETKDMQESFDTIKKSNR